MESIPIAALKALESLELNAKAFWRLQDNGQGLISLEIKWRIQPRKKKNSPPKISNSPARAKPQQPTNHIAGAQRCDYRPRRALERPKTSVRDVLASRRSRLRLLDYQNQKFGENRVFGDQSQVQTQKDSSLPAKEPATTEPPKGCRIEHCRGPSTGESQPALFSTATQCSPKPQAMTNIVEVATQYSPIHMASSTSQTDTFQYTEQSQGVNPVHSQPSPVAVGPSSPAHSQLNPNIRVQAGACNAAHSFLCPGTEDPCTFVVHPEAWVHDILDSIQEETGIQQPLCLLDYRDGQYWSLPMDMEIGQLVNRTGRTSFNYDLLSQSNHIT